MEKKGNQQIDSADLYKCPHCPCCFCNETDLKHHMNIYGISRQEHAKEFRRTHGIIEYGSTSGPE